MSWRATEQSVFAPPAPTSCSPPDLAQALALIIHELGTNAAKYGALSSPNGVVTINWEVANEVVSLTWKESGGPAIETPSKVGFGSTLITSLLTPLKGSATMDFRPDRARVPSEFQSQAVIRARSVATDWKSRLFVLPS